MRTKPGLRAAPAQGWVLFNIVIGVTTATAYGSRMSAWSQGTLLIILSALALAGLVAVPRSAMNDPRDRPTRADAGAPGRNNKDNNKDKASTSASTPAPNVAAIGGKVVAQSSPAAAGV